MIFSGRPFGRVLTAPFKPEHYASVWNILRLTERPVDTSCRYIFNTGQYPATIVARTPIGPVDIVLYSYHDMRTFNEIFCRGDYPADPTDEIIVDFGSNIGISAAYFLSRSRRSFLYLFEPLPRNLERLRKNLRAFEARYRLAEIAVGLADGPVTFGWEATGRYGGIGRETGQYTTVQARDSNSILRDIIAEHGRIDILKIDIETLEQQVTERITPAIAAHIGKIFVEYPIEPNPLASTHRMVSRPWFRQFLPLSVPGLDGRRPAG